MLFQALKNKNSLMRFRTSLMEVCNLETFQKNLRVKVIFITYKLRFRNTYEWAPFAITNGTNRNYADKRIL